MEVKVLKNIMYANETLARENRRFFKENKVTAVNVMASPGAGKTSIILKVIENLKNDLHISVIEGDIASSIDAEKIDKLGIPVVQINTGGGCHLDANMIKEAVADIRFRGHSLLMIENVGNLVCPSSFDLGEEIKMVIASVPEGHDKPYKYTSMFEAADVIVLNKIDILPYIDFDRAAFIKGIKALNESAPIFEISCSKGEGVTGLIEWLRKKQGPNNLMLIVGDGMRIAVIDGQGGGIGKAIVEKLRKELPEETEIVALGANSMATSFMLRAGANEGATGENAIVYNAGKVDVIIGALGIIVANSMLGELTPLMAKAIAESPAKKVLLPLNRCNIEIVGVDKNEPMPHLIDKAVKAIKENMTR